MKFGKVKKVETKTEKVTAQIAKILKDNNCIIHAVPDYQIMIVEKPEEKKDAFEKVGVKDGDAEAKNSVE